MAVGANIYLDNAASTKPCQASVDALVAALAEEYGNASSLHARGQGAKLLLEQSRAVLADALGVEPAEVYFTSGATESNNLAIRGCVEARGPQAGAIVTSELEHASVTRTVRGMRRMGWETKHVPAVGGVFDMERLEKELSKPCQLVSVVQVQNEVGYQFPIAQIADLVSNAASKEGVAAPLVHTDATQAFGKLEVLPAKWGIDLLSVSSHKLFGPKGAGALYVRRNTKMFTMAFGGGQERGLRSGTEAVFLAAGFAAAVKEAMAAREHNFAHASSLNNYLRARLRKDWPTSVVHSREDGSPYILSFALPGCDNRVLVRGLSERGICVSHASACTFNRHNVDGPWREKHPLSMQAAGISEELASATLRVSFSPENSTADIDALLGALLDLAS